MRDSELKSFAKSVKRHIFLAIFAGVSLLLLWFIVAVMVVVWMFNTFIAPQLGQETMLRMEERNPVQRGQQWLDQRMYGGERQIQQLQLQVDELRRTVEELKTATPGAAAPVASPAPQPVGE